MRTGWVMVAGGAMALAGAAMAANNSGFDKIRISRAALGSSRIVVWTNTEINPDCTEHQPGATLTVLKPPAHGEVQVVKEDDFAAYGPNNPRSACNHRKVPVNHAYYTAGSGYRGKDKLVLQGSSDEGRVREITVDIDVR